MSETLTDQERRRLWREGGVLVFAWGPPWDWAPSFQRSRYHPTGWSLTWLWWGLTYYPISMATLAIDGAYPRCDGCDRRSRAEELVEVPGESSDSSRLCPACREATS